MVRFFALFCWFCALLYLVALGAGHFNSQLSLSPSTHIILGLSAGIVVSCLHCLVFAIFTGSGKDTRLLVQDWELDKDFVMRTKRFKREVFPPALYAIFFVLLVLCFGGALASLSKEAAWVRGIHLTLAWLCFFYNVKVMRKEYAAVKENALIIGRLNHQATDTIETLRKEGKSSYEPLTPAEEVIEWGTHVYAFGKFLTFMGFNVWFPYLYIKVVLRWPTLLVWPFIVVSLVFLLGGAYLRSRYQCYRPGHSQKGQS